MTDTPPIDPDLAERLRPFTTELRALADHLDAAPSEPASDDPEAPKPTPGRTEITEDLMSELRAERDAAFAARRPSYIETSTTN